MRWLPLTAAFVAFSFLTLGCGGRDANVPVNRPAPVLSDLSITPERFDHFAGGSATVRVSVQSQRSILAVLGEMTPANQSGAGKRLFVLLPVGNGLYQATIEVPSNISPTGQEAVYAISVVAEDADGERSNAATGQVRVAAPDSPPLPL